MNIKKLFIASLLFLGISFLGTNSINAATYQIAQGSDGGQLYVTVDNIKAVYSPGESVRASMCLYNNSGALNSTSLAGGTNGTWKTYVTGTGCNDTEVGIAPNSAGSYAVNYTANYNRSASPQCSDGVDNDGDGLVDYPADPGCSSPSDNDEYNAPVARTVPYSLDIGHESGYTIRATITLAETLPRAVSFYVDSEYFHRQIQGPEGSAIFNITIPAGSRTGSALFTVPRPSYFVGTYAEIYPSALVGGYGGGSFTHVAPNPNPVDNITLQDNGHNVNWNLMFYK